MSEAIATVEGCASESALNETLQRIIEGYGFAAYCFLDIGRPDLDVPYYAGTTGRGWEEEYQHNNFIHVDEVVRLARRTNRPFNWARVPLPPRLGVKKPGSLKTMEAAADYGFREALVIPFHYADQIGRVHSSSCSLIWKDQVRDFGSVLSLAHQELHLILIYWMQRSIEVRMAPSQGGTVVDIAEARTAAFSRSLTDRERAVLAWAARAKTAEDTAEILHISTSTVETHLKSAIDKLGAGNKTHAVALGITSGLIDL